MAKQTLYLVDISSYVFRAYYAVKALKTSKGVPTNATYGVVTMLLKLIRSHKPDHLAVVFDSPIPTFRKEMYPDYKAHRPPPPEDLPVQFDHIKEYIAAYGLPHLEAPGFEADDIIATLVDRFGKQGVDIVIVSADKDLMQLIAPGVTMYDGLKEKIFTHDDVVEKFGVGPDKVVDILGLSGDTSDNIPGVKGVGGKTAAKLIQEYGSIENLLEHASQIKGKLGENLKACHAEALLSKKLATLNHQVPLNLSWEQLLLKEPDKSALNNFYRHYEFHRLVEKGEQEKGEQEKGEQEKGEQERGEQGGAQAASYELVLTKDQLQAWIQKIKQAKGFAFDTETTGLNSLTSKLVGLSLSTSAHSACYIPLMHSYLGCPEQLDKDDVIGALKPFLEDIQRPKYAQNAKYDMQILSQEGVFVQGLAGDSLLASYLVDPEAAHNLDRLAKEYLHYDTLHYEDVVGKGKFFSDVELETACRYAAEDADVAYRLINELHPLLKQEKLWDCYYKIEIPLVHVLAVMERNGVLVDILFLKKLAEEFSQRLQKLEKEIYAAAGTEFNLNSPKQVAHVLFTKLALPSQRKTKTGESTDVDVLMELSPMHPVPRGLLDYRMLSKLKSTYIDGLIKLVNPNTGRIHTSYNQTVAATGRLSSSDPNLQNIPIRSEEGRRIREAFIAPPGFIIMSADYSQIELRLLASFSQ